MNPPGVEEKNPTVIVQAVRQLSEGRRNTTGTFTITQNADTTSVSHPNFGAGSVPIFTPLHANAAAELATMYVSSRSNGSFIVTHDNSATANRTFLYSFDG